MQVFGVKNDASPKLGHFRSSSLFSVYIGIISAVAQDKKTPKQLLFINVNIFDGKSEQLLTNRRVLVEGNLIKTVDDETLKANEDATVINGGGRTLMPGLSDTHVDILFASIPQVEMFTGLPSYVFIRSTIDAEAMLMRGVTSVRDMGDTHSG